MISSTFLPIFYNVRVATPPKAGGSGNNSPIKNSWLNRANEGGSRMTWHAGWTTGPAKARPTRHLTPAPIVSEFEGGLPPSEPSRWIHGGDGRAGSSVHSFGLATHPPHCMGKTLNLFIFHLGPSCNVNCFIFFL